MTNLWKDSPKKSILERVPKKVEAGLKPQST